MSTGRQVITQYHCELCDEPYPARRAHLGYTTCLKCGEMQSAVERKMWTIAPAGPKQGYTRITNRADLIGIYKGSTIR